MIYFKPDVKSEQQIISIGVTAPDLDYDVKGNPQLQFKINQTQIV